MLSGAFIRPMIGERETSRNLQRPGADRKLNHFVIGTTYYVEGTGMPKQNDNQGHARARRQREKERAFSEWLLMRSQQGNREAQNSLLALWQERYYLYALRRLGCSDAARDVTQEALFSICRNLGKLKDLSTFPAWSYRILERRCVDWLRKTIRERAVIDTGESVPEIAAPEKPDSGIGLAGLLGSLEPEIRSLLQLYYLDELSVAEIATILDIPRGTVKSRLFYARKLLADEIDTTRGDPK